MFRFRPFEDYSEVACELGESKIAFLLPDQLRLLPDKSVDLSIAIDSLHEMRPAQIDYFFDAVDRLTRRFFYFKCWKHTRIPYDDITLTEHDYPVRRSWVPVFWRDCELLTYPTWRENRVVEETYFEALLSLWGTENQAAPSPPGSSRGCKMSKVVNTQ